MTQKLINEETQDASDLFDETASDTASDEKIAESDNITELDISHLVIEDDTPLDNFQSELQQRLLVEPLYSANALPSPFLAAANVGLFYKISGDSIVPDVMLSLGVQRGEDFSRKQNRSYFVWEMGKVPEVCIEIVSNKEGDELTLSRRSRREGKTTAKKDIYAQIAVRYYVVFDPLEQLQNAADMNGARLRVWSITPEGYSELTTAAGITTPGQSIWLNGVGVGLTLWEGCYQEEVSRLWLRWCDRQGQVIPTGAERAETEAARADNAETRADSAEARADNAEARAQRLAEQLRALGMTPDS
jgi:hypothetical protein